MTADDGEGSRSESDGERPASKVADLIGEYDLGEGFGRHLEDLWTAEEDRKSLRALAELFNKRLLERAMVENGFSPLDGEVDNVYRLLNGEEVSSGSRTEARTRLEQGGVDVEKLERDFVTYQAIRSYLTEYRSAEYESGGSQTDVPSTRATVQKLQSRMESVLGGSLRQLRDAGDITLGSFRVFVDVSVLCEDCDVQYPITELLEGGCDCEQ